MSIRNIKKNPIFLKIRKEEMRMMSEETEETEEIAVAHASRL